MKSYRYIHGFKTKLLVLNPYIYLLNSMCTITISLFRWNQIEIYYILFVLLKWNQMDIYMGLKKKKVIRTHDQWEMKKSILKNMRDEKIHFVKCKRQNNSFCKMLRMKKFILWNVKDYELDYIKFDLTILFLKNDHVQGT